MADEHWTSTVEHPKFSDPAVKDAFVKAYSKYDTQADGLMGGLEAIKAVGKPFKLPESIDKLPNDEIKVDFVNQVGKLMGVVDRIEDLGDLNLTVGMPEGSKADENLANRFKNFVIEKRVPKGIAQEVIGLHNILTAETRQKEEEDFKKECDTAHNTLVGLYNGENGLKQKSELVRRMFQNDLGLSAEEFESEVVKGIIDTGMTRNAVLYKALINAAEKLSKEGTTTGSGEPGGEVKKSQYQINKEKWPKSPELWGDPNK